MKRLLAALFLVSLMAALVPTATAAIKPRIPTSAADWATFSSSERAAALDYEWNLFQASLQSGTAVVHTIGRTQSGQVAELGGAAPLVTVGWDCPLQWTDQVDGTWTRGGGWTDTSSQVYYLAASRVAKKGQFLRDGALQGNWYNETYNDPDTRAESWSGYNWKWWYEHFNFVNKGWHGARVTSTGSWLVGPDQYCTVSVYR